MKVYLKLLEDEKKEIDALKEAINNLDIERIDNIKSRLFNKSFDFSIEEKKLPNEFREYIISYKNLKYTDCKQINSLIKKAKETKKDILVIWGKNEKF